MATPQTDIDELVQSEKRRIKKPSSSNTASGRYPSVLSNLEAAVNGYSNGFKEAEEYASVNVTNIQSVKSFMDYLSEKPSNGNDFEVPTASSLGSWNVVSPPVEELPKITKELEKPKSQPVVKNTPPPRAQEEIKPTIFKKREKEKLNPPSPGTPPRAQTAPPRRGGGIFGNRRRTISTNLRNNIERVGTGGSRARNIFQRISLGRPSFAQLIGRL